MVRKDGGRKGKLVRKAEEPFIVKGFTDNSRQMATIADVNDVTWTKQVADLRMWAAAE